MAGFFMTRPDDVDTSTPEREAERQAADMPAGFGETLGSMAGQTTGAAMRFAKRHWNDDISQPLDRIFGEGMMHPRQEEHLTAEQINKTYGLPPEHGAKEPMSAYSAKLFAEGVKSRITADEVWRRYSKDRYILTNIGTGMIGAMLDPIEAGAMMVPGVGEGRVALALTEAGIGAKTAIVAGKMAAGGTAAMAGTAALMPMRAVTSWEESFDYGARDALHEMIFSLPFGALMHAGISPMIGAGMSRLTGVPREPYFHEEYVVPPKEAPEDITAAEVAAAARRGAAMPDMVPDRSQLPMSYGHIHEVEMMNGIQAHILNNSTVAQLLEMKKPDAGQWLFPDLSHKARALAPEAHAEWDALNAELQSLKAEHVWGKAPTPEEAASPEWRLEQELREQVRDILPVSWDLRVAASLDEGKPGSAFSFGGQEAASPPPGREKAIQMEAQGIPKERIWEETGWHKGATGHWLFEIDDSKATLDERALADAKRPYRGPLAGIFDHEELFDQFPQLRGIETEIAVGDRWKPGGKLIHTQTELRKILAAGPTIEEAKKTLIHELRHAVQVIQQEPMQKGVEVPVWNKIVDEVKKALGPDVIKAHGNQIDQDIRYAIYHHSLHEIEARIAGARTEMTPEERRATPPFTTKETLTVEPNRQTLTGDYLERYNIVHEIVQNILGRDVFDIDTYKVQHQKAMAASEKARVEAEAAGRAAAEREASARAEREKAAKVKADAETAAKREQEANEARIAAEREAAEAHAQRTEAEAARAEAELARLKEEHARAVEDAERRKQAQAEAEQALAKADANLSDAKQKVKYAETIFKHAKEDEKLIAKKLYKIQSYVKELELIRQDRAYINQRRESMISDLNDAIKAEEAKQKEVEARQKEIDKARAEEEASRKAAEEAQRKIDAIRGAEDYAALTEQKAVKAQADLDALLAEIERRNAKADEAAQAAAKAEEGLAKAEEGLGKAKAAHEEAQRRYDEVQKEFDKAKADYEAVREAAERHEVERYNQIREEKPLIVAQGMTDPATRTAWISAMAVDPRLVAREESGHAIRASGLFKPDEWGILRDAAINRGWIDDMPKAVQERYREAYADRGPEGVRDAMVEEAVMQRFAKGPEAWGPEGGPISRLMYRIQQLLERIGNWMTSRGFKSADDVFRAMDEGKISARDTMPAHANRRAAEIEARLNELKPQIVDAYSRVKQEDYTDLPSLAELQRTRAKYGEAQAFPEGQLIKALEQIYAPEAPKKISEAKFGDMPEELQLQEQRFKAMIDEGHVMSEDEAKEYMQTTAAVKEAMDLEQGYGQAVECLIAAGI